MASFIHFSLAMLLACIAWEVRSYPPGDKVTQGFRDVTSADVDTGKDYRYSDEGDIRHLNKPKKAGRSTSLEDLDMDFVNFDSDEEDTSEPDDFTTSDDQPETTLEKPPTVARNCDGMDRSKRQVDVDLRAYRDRLLEHLNEYRSEIGLTQLQVDEELEQGAQEWATAESEVFAMSHSCEDCHDFAEVLAKRRSTKPLPTGAGIADWAYKTLFSDDADRTYASITDDADVHLVGFGIAFRRNPTDKTYHAYAVLRFARG